MFGASKRYVVELVNDSIENVLKKLDTERKVNHEKHLALRAEQNALHAKLDEITDRLNKVTDGVLGLQQAPTVSADTLATVNELYAEMMDRQVKKPAVELLCGQMENVRESVKDLRLENSKMWREMKILKDGVDGLGSEVKRCVLSQARLAPKVGPSEEHLLRGARLQMVELMARLVGTDRAEEGATRAMAFIETGKWPKVPAPPPPPGAV